MVSVLIVDTSKASIVMTSEICKEKIPAVRITIAYNGLQCLEYLKQETYDICMVDFDLPDVDGPTLILEMRKSFHGPIFLTAFPDEIVDIAVKAELFLFNDVYEWLPKPLKSKEVAERINKFFVDNYSLERRFGTEITTKINQTSSITADQRGVSSTIAQVANISIGGICLKFEHTPQLIENADVRLTLGLPIKIDKKTQTQSKTNKLAAKICWKNNDCHIIGMRFKKLSLSQREGLNNLLRNLFDK